MSKQPEILTIPGAVDVHVHLREPSANKSETIESGTKAALLGGYVAIFDMSNNPGNETWTMERVVEKSRLILRSAHIPVGIWSGGQPTYDNLNQYEGVAPHVIGDKSYLSFTTGNHVDYKAEEFVPKSRQIKKHMPEKPVGVHAGDQNLQEFLGRVAGDLSLKVHVCHINNPEHVDLIKKGRKRGWDITCGVCPHHLFMTDEDVKQMGWFARMQPPLVSRPDSEKLFRQLIDSDIDIIETDHAPHSKKSKLLANKDNPEGILDPEHVTCFGVPSLEFAMKLMLTAYVQKKISRERLVEVSSTKPAQIMGIKLSPKTEVTWELSENEIAQEDIVSGAGWSPFIGRKVFGRLIRSQIGCFPLVEDGQIIASLPKVIHRGDTV